MLDPQELKQFEEVVQLVVRKEITDSESRLRSEITQAEDRVVTQLRSEITQVEERVTAKVDQLSADVGGFMDISILPQVEEKADKKEVKRIADKTLEHEGIFKKL